jgi:hypothetical protein
MINLINISRMSDGSENDPQWLAIREDRIANHLPSYVLDYIDVEYPVLEELWTRTFEQRVETFLQLLARDIERQAALAYDELLLEELY